MNDTAFAGSGNGADDPIYRAVLGGTPVPEAKDPDEALPKGIYVVEFSALKGQFQGDEKLPAVRGSATVIHGVHGTEGRTAFASARYAASKFKWVKPPEGGDKVKVPRTQEEFQAAGAEEAGPLIRLASVLGFLKVLPDKPHTQESLDAFGLQFAGKRAVIRISYLPGRGEYGASNLFLWESIRTLDETVKDKKGVVQGKALDWALREIAKADEAAKKKAGKATVATAGGYGGAKPSEFQTA